MITEAFIAAVTRQLPDGYTVDIFGAGSDLDIIGCGFWYRDHEIALLIGTDGDLNLTEYGNNKGHVHQIHPHDPNSIDDTVRIIVRCGEENADVVDRLSRLGLAALGGPLRKKSPVKRY